MEQQITELLEQNQELIQALQSKENTSNNKITSQFQEFEEENENFVVRQLGWALNFSRSLFQPLVGSFLPASVLQFLGGRGSLIVKLTDPWPACLQFEPCTNEDPSCRGDRCM
ncbi:hypothetical protein TNCV_873831 [Trichonephila clavipes]|nr:hypothetical protein TNCV_873831 [Trichonephila clavipes]